LSGRSKNLRVEGGTFTESPAVGFRCDHRLEEESPDDRNDIGKCATALYRLEFFLNSGEAAKSDCWVAQKLGLHSETSAKPQWR